MELLKNFDWSLKSIWKIVLVVIWAILVFTIVASLASLSIRTITNPWVSDMRYWSMASEWAPIMMGKRSFALDSNNVALSTQDAGMGSLTSEDYEVKSIDTQINTHFKNDVCSKFQELKAKQYIIFENSNSSEKSCYFNLKVEKDRADEVLSLIKSYDPEYLNENIETIKRQVDNFSSEIDILQKKLDSIEITLKDAQKQYDDLTKLATQKSDTESLAKIIDSKLNLINKLSDERVNANAQMMRFKRDKEIQLERLNYSFFNINIVEELFFDWKAIKDDWKNTIKNFIFDINDIIKAISIDLVEYLLRFVQISIYFFISLILLKWVWFVTKKIWNWKWELPVKSVKTK